MKNIINTVRFMSYYPHHINAILLATVTMALEYRNRANISVALNLKICKLHQFVSINLLESPMCLTEIIR